MIGKLFRQKVIVALCASTGLYACFGGSGEQPGEVEAFDEIAADETINALGNEPFWSATIGNDILTYSTPENIDGQKVAITRFAGNGGLGVSGRISEEDLNIAITPGECSDTMSDRSYPFTVTLIIGDKQLNGCAYTESQPFIGEERV